jgi:hypothetical protein
LYKFAPHKDTSFTHNFKHSVLISKKILAIAKTILTESEVNYKINFFLDENFYNATQASSIQGRLIVTGIGKAP